MTCKPSNEIASPGRYWDARTRARLRHRRAAAGGQTENAEKRAAKKLRQLTPRLSAVLRWLCHSFLNFIHVPYRLQFTSEPYAVQTTEYSLPQSLIIITSTVRYIRSRAPLPYPINRNPYPN